MTDLFTVDTGNWYVEIDRDGQTGWFKNNHLYARGTLEFDSGKLVNFEGMRNLPQEVVAVIKNAGYSVLYL